MKNNILKTVLIASLTMVVVGCSGNEDEIGEEIEREEGEDVEVGGINEDENTNVGEGDEDLGKRTNPYNIGETVTLDIVDYNEEGEEFNGKLDLTLSNIVRGEDALDIMRDEYTEYGNYEEEYEEGYEWMVMDMTAQLVEYSSENEDFTVSGYPVSVLRGDGTPAPNTIGMFEEGISATGIYEGGKVEGKVARPIPLDGDYLIKYEDTFSDIEIFFTNN